MEDCALKCYQKLTKDMSYLPSLNEQHNLVSFCVISCLLKEVSQADMMDLKKKALIIFLWIVFILHRVECEKPKDGK